MATARADRLSLYVVSSVSGLRVASLGRTVFYSVGRTTKH